VQASLIKVLVNDLSGGFKQNYLRRVWERAVVLRDWRPEDNLTHGLGLPRREHIAARPAVGALRRGQKHATLELAKVLTACDDFLPRVAPFFEVDSVNPLKVDHLGDKLLNRSTNNPWLSREYF
jgi:hypothetical protein